uniref:Uncharacterized protein n=1 Tax=Oryza brachyantha TaxID=4533 RepID=J3MSK8_ORYBR
WFFLLLLEKLLTCCISSHPSLTQHNGDPFDLEALPTFFLHGDTSYLKQTSNNYLTN